MLLLLQIVLLIRKYTRWPYHMEYIDLFSRTSSNLFLVPRISQISTDFVSRHSLSYLIRVSVSSVDYITSNYSCPTDFTDFVSWHPLSYLSVSSVSSVGFIPSTYSCPTDFTDLHRFRHLAFIVLTNPCHLCNLWALLFRQVMSLKISLIR